MDRVNCDAHSCSHNKDNVCYANRVNIGGSGAQVDGETCCGSFLNRLLYSDLTNNTNGGGSCDTLVCFVNSCRHNCNTLCELQNIQVAGPNAELYQETECRSFED